MRNDGPDWRDWLLLIRFMWRHSSTLRWWLAGLLLAMQFLWLTPNDATLDVMIVLLFLGFLLIAASFGGLGG